MQHVLHGSSWNMLQGDMIPWTISQQYQDTEFPRLSGARVVRIAAHPDMTRAGYGSRALELLRRYFEGDLADLVPPRPTSSWMANVYEALLKSQDLCQKCWLCPIVLRDIPEQDLRVLMEREI